MQKKIWYESKDALKDSAVDAFNGSFKQDRKLLEFDIDCSVAYADALLDVGVLSKPEAARIKKHLAILKKKLPLRKYPVLPEDVHTAVEMALAEKLGKESGKIHTGRSRNEQVVTDERLFLKKEIASLSGAIGHLQKEMLSLVECNMGVMMPSYTHLQQAQPVLFSFCVMSWFFMVQRDRERLVDCLKRVDVSTYGSGAVSGNSYGVDRLELARKLGFSAVSENALDAVSDRDFIVEFLSCCSIIMMHLSRFCEDLVIWSSSEFGFVKVAEGLATSSSLMPQKLNPDALELIRGKTGRVYGDLVSLLTTMKGIPTGYNKDMQEDKRCLFDSARTTGDCVKIFAIAVKTLKIMPERMEKDMNSSILATDLADHLVSKGVSFRQAHTSVSKLVRYSLSKPANLHELKTEEFMRFSEAFGKDATDVLDFRRSIARKNVRGGTAPAMVLRQIGIAKKLLKKM